MPETPTTIENFIDAQGVALLASVDENGFPNTKAMLPPRKREGLRVFWFSTNTSSLRVAQLRANAKSSLYFFDQRLFRGVQLVGTTQVLTEAASKQMLWQEGDTLYYPQGVADPDYCVLKFTAKHGRYYHDFSTQCFLVE